MDPKQYPNPRMFDPSRYAHDRQNASEAASNPIASQRDQYVFGAGRRVCQGMHIAERSLFLGIARMLWAFKFEQAKDTNGEDVLPDISKLTQGLFVMPERFPARITPRSEKHVECIRREWADCAQLLDSKMQWREVPAGMNFSSYAPEK
jgi:cytochrome P450